MSFVRLALVVPLLGLCVLHLAASEAVGFAERFALAEDREAVLDELVPGTDEHFYYRALLHQQRGELAAVEALLERWRQRHRTSPQRGRIEFRQILLRYAEDPAGSLLALATELDLHFTHQSERRDGGPVHPNRLDQRLVGWQAFRARVHGARPEGLTDQGLWRFLDDPAVATHRRRVLQRLRWADHPRVMELVLADLRDDDTPGFGSLELHDRLTRTQLDQLRGRLPALADEAAWVAAYLRTLLPSDAVDWQRDRVARVAWFDRTWAFAQDLPPVHNSLKLHLLHHRLELDRQMGVFDHERFMTYLRLPRAMDYVEPRWLRRFRGDERAEPGRDFGPATPLPPVGGNDEELVRFFLLHYLREAADTTAYDGLVRDGWLERLLVEAKVTAGIGDPERWFARLDEPGFFQHLRERVDIEIAPTNPEYLAPDEAVELAVAVKNVERLLVRIYEIDAGNVYRETGRELSVELDLDGLVANHERELRLDAPPLRRIEHRLPLPEIVGEGTWIVELIGNGRSSRALIRKGQLLLDQEPTAAGHRCRILDVAGSPRPQAALWLDGHRYTAGDDGTIMLPFTVNPGTQAVVLEEGALASLDRFGHLSERYTLEAAIHLDRESLIAGAEAPLVVRARLDLHGHAVPIGFVTDERLTITATDASGTEITFEVPGLELDERGETVHRFRVPADLRRIDVRLEGEVEQVSTGETQHLHTRRSFELNGVADTVQVAQSHLAATAAGWVLHRRDRNGDPVAGLPVRCTFHHRDFASSYGLVLATDAQGRIELGALEDIIELEAAVDGDPVGARHWNLPAAANPQPERLHGSVGEPLRIPWTDAGEDTRREDLALFELRGGRPAVDRFAHLRLRGGYLELVDLPPGDYALALKRVGREIAVRVDQGPVHGGALQAAARRLELSPRTPLTLQRVALEDDALVIALAGHDAATRVHVFADRFLPTWDHLAGLALDAEQVTVEPLAYPASSAVSGRRIGDEYRYILDRQRAPRYPGNMLERPGLLLNPWSRSETETAMTAQGGAAGAFGNRRGGGSRQAVGRYGGARATESLANRGSDLDWLAEPATLLLSRRPDADGTLRIPRAELGAAMHLRVVAIAPGATVGRRLLLAEQPIVSRDRRLLDGFGSEAHVARQQRVSVLAAGDELVLADVTSARLQLYDSLSDIFALYRSLAPAAELTDFAFLTEWAELDAEQRRDRYDEFACHELHLYCYLKDRQFFDAVVAPYLADKKDPTFLDQWLLGVDLSAWRAPERYQRLNLMERVLLGKRIEAEAEPSRRHLRERFALLERDRAELGRLFTVAIRGRSLGTDDELGLREAKERLAELSPPAPSQGRQEARAASEMVLPVEELETEDAADGFDLQVEQRAQQRRYYRPLEPTREWAENNYYHLPYARQDGDLLPVNAFWRDLAEHSGFAGFRSPNLAEAAGSRTEILLALALLDLPVAAQAHEVAYEGDAMRLRAASPAIAFHEEFRPVEALTADGSLLMRQLAYRHGERYREVDGERLDAEIRDEFVVDTPYSLEVVVTNTASRARDVDLLLQIPEGALPLAGASATRGLPLTIEPYATVRREISFFFPRPGDFEHFPAHLGAEDQVLARAQPIAFHVVAEPSAVDTGSWHHVSQYAPLDHVLAYLEQHNLQRLDLGLLAWRLRDAEAYRRLIGTLEAQHAYHPVLWSYALHHDDGPRIRSYLQRRGIHDRVGAWIASPLFTSDPVFDGRYRHLEYVPLVNPRAHDFGGERRIHNAELRVQYGALMEQLAHKRTLDQEDRLAVSYYLFLQDRVSAALEAFDRVERERIDERLQYDYLACYAAFYRRDTATARSIAQGHAEHPVPRWRERFARVLAQLDTVADGEQRVVDPEDAQQHQAGLAATEPAFSLALEGGELLIDHQRLASCTVNYYLMDVELLFSRDPFAGGDAERFGVIRPNASQVVELPGEAGVERVALPEAMRSRNVLIEVVGAGRRRSVTSFANALSVQVVENYGQLQVRHRESRQPLAAVYVKVYARLDDGSEVFYKDGYTDLRGRFDYLALSTDELGRAREFALLVLSDEHGAVTRRIDPPKR